MVSSTCSSPPCFARVVAAVICALVIWRLLCLWLVVTQKDPVTMTGAWVVSNSHQHSVTISHRGLDGKKKANAVHLSIRRHVRPRFRTFLQKLLSLFSVGKHRVMIHSVGLHAVHIGVAVIDSISLHGLVPCSLPRKPRHVDGVLILSRSDPIAARTFGGHDMTARFQLRDSCDRHLLACVKFSRCFACCLTHDDQ